MLVVSIDRRASSCVELGRDGRGRFNDVRVLVRSIYYDTTNTYYYYSSTNKRERPNFDLRTKSRDRDAINLNEIILLLNHVM
jgi:hypothetical protein